MIGLIDSQNTAVNDTAVIQRLARAIALSDGEFSLLLACCDVDKQEQVLSLLEEFSMADIKQVVLSRKAKTLYTNVVSELGSARQPDALVVRGLESVEAINELIISTNLMRDEFAKQFKFPLVLFVNEEILRKLIWLAPDLKDWAASTLRFHTSSVKDFVKCY